MRHHIFDYFTKPVTGRNNVALFCKRSVIPKFFVIECLGVIAAFQKNAFHPVKVVLQAVVVSRKNTRTKCYLEHSVCKFNIHSYF